MAHRIFGNSGFIWHAPSTRRGGALPPYFKGGGIASTCTASSKRVWKPNQYFSCSEIRACHPNVECFIRYVNTRSIWLISYVCKVSFLVRTGSDNTCPWHKHRIFHTYEVYLMVVCTYALRFSFSPFFSVSVDSTSICFILFFLFECVPFNLGRNSYHMHVRYDEYIYQYTGWSFPPAQWPWLFVVFFMYLLVVDCRVGRRYMPYMHASAWVGIPFSLQLWCILCFVLRSTSACAHASINTCR